MSARPLISVVMPAYNAGPWIWDAMTSIINQTYGNWELLVCDDASTDNTAEVVRYYTDARIRTFSNLKNLGYLHTCNRLFAEAQGEFITFLDADDSCPANRLELCLSQFWQRPDLGSLITGHSRHFDNERSEIRVEPIDCARIATDANYSPTLCGATLFARAELLKIAGGYNPVFAQTGAEDHHLIFRLAQLAPIAHLAENLYYYRIHQSAVKNTLLQPERHIGHALDRAIRSQFLVHNNDLLASGNKPLLDAQYAKLLQPFDDDQGLIHQKASISYMNLGHWRVALAHAFRGLIAAPSSASIKNIVFVTYVMLRRSMNC